MEKKEVGMEGLMELNDAVGYLEGIVKSLKEGKIFVQKGEEVVELNPEKNVFFELNVKQKKSKEKISIDLFWGKNTKEEKEEEPEQVVISSKGPAGYGTEKE
ncbi:MAG: amphi-Trp domain-containing protein [Candidatus Goldbacteria bacterium]|nr:amphi-Trp domain-containing protein [Candidatus Goldiibacteriota bacterium]